jgi:DNA-directed RNA polymerase specialized sigma24 family protein
MNYIKRRLTGDVVKGIAGNPMSTLQEYEQIALKIISTTAGGNWVGLMLNSEDAISHVSEAIMMADWRFDAKRGTTRHRWRSVCARKAIKNFQTGIYKNAKLMEEALPDRDIEDRRHDGIAEDIVEDEDSQSRRSYVQSLMSCLSTSQREAIEAVVVDGKTYTKAGRDLGKSVQSIHAGVTMGLHKLRRLAGAA